MGSVMDSDNSSTVIHDRGGPWMQQKLEILKLDSETSVGRQLKK
jgi:hypothetical protein